MNRIKLSITFSAFLLFVLLGCQSKLPKELLIEEFETFFVKEVKPKLDDPNSYEKINSEIMDTVFVWEMLDNIIALKKETYEAYKKQCITYQEEYLKSIDLAKKYESFLPSVDLSQQRIIEYNAKFKIDSIRTDSLLNTLKAISPTDISYIIINHNFHAKNRSGDLLVGQFSFSYYPAEQDVSKKFRIRYQLI